MSPSLSLAIAMPYSDDPDAMPARRANPKFGAIPTSPASRSVRSTPATGVNMAVTPVVLASLSRVLSPPAPLVVNV
jgi:hypothetical protein